MIRIRSRSTSRPAFTLIELLVVIAIIAVLVSLTAAGVMKVMWKIPEIQTRTDISQLDSALGAFMGDYNLSDPPPSKLVLLSNIGAYPAGDPNLAFLKKVFGKNVGAAGPIAWSGITPTSGSWTLEGEQCLVFYLGGIPTISGVTPQCEGFSTNNLNPAAVGGKRRGPYMQFNPSRLVAAPNGFFVYNDAWKTTPHPNGFPYAYFSSNGINNGYSLTDCAGLPAAPYRDLGGTFTNSNKYQIISAGQNGAFGTGVWNPAAGAQDVGGRDDQANFSSKILSAGQQ